MRALLLAALALVGAGQATDDVWQITLKDGTIVWNLRLDTLRRDTIVFHQDKKTLRYPLLRVDEMRLVRGEARGRRGGRRRALRRRRQRDERRGVSADSARPVGAPPGDGGDPAHADRPSASMTGRRILLADADAFYVAVARLFDPEGAGKAHLLIVGGAPERRGVVTSARSEERRVGKEGRSRW